MEKKNQIAEVLKKICEILNKNDIKYALIGGLADIGFYENAIKRRIIIDFEGVKLPVVSREDLILIKLLSGREIDMFDVGNILTDGNTLDKKHC